MVTHCRGTDEDDERLRTNGSRKRPSSKKSLEVEVALTNDGVV